MTNHAVQLATLYDSDFYAWIEQQSQLLKKGQLAELDLENLLEELETLGRSQKQKVRSNLKRLLLHLLRWNYQPDKRSNSWRFSVIEHQQRLRQQLKDSPSLKPHFFEVFDEAYQDARELASAETGISLASFPVDCPFSPDSVLQASLVQVEGDRAP